MHAEADSVSGAVAVGSGPLKARALAVPTLVSALWRESSVIMCQFQIHNQLLSDCQRFGRFALCHLLLHKNASLPWFILVPETAVTDLLDLPKDAQNLAMMEAAMVSRFITQELLYPKINFASIGNVVPQLHLHVVGRRPDDPCWPAPVWGHLTQQREYAAGQIAAMTAALVQRYSLKPMP